jgi:methionyl aminopeptidase
MRRNAEELAKMRKAGKVVAEIHEKTRAVIRPGVTTRQIDAVSRQVLEQRGARSNFLNYHGFPATVCTSPNDMIVHGIPSDLVLEEGDIISVDCGAIIEGYHGDAAYTAGVGEVSAEARRLMEVTEASLWKGIEQLRDGNRRCRTTGPVRPARGSRSGTCSPSSPWSTPAAPRRSSSPTGGVS